jgi:anti-sigma factor RsiW
MDDRVEAYIDGTLSAPEQERFEARLRGDLYWQEQVERARSIQDALRAKSPATPPADLPSAILRHASAPSHACKSRTRPRWSDSNR